MAQLFAKQMERPSGIKFPVCRLPPPIVSITVSPPRTWWLIEEPVSGLESSFPRPRRLTRTPGSSRSCCSSTAADFASQSQVISQLAAAAAADPFSSHDPQLITHVGYVRCQSRGILIDTTFLVTTQSLITGS